MNSVSRETSCPNPWHQSAPARRCQLCPECPWTADAYRGCTFDLGVALPHLPACAEQRHDITSCYLAYVEYMMTTGSATFGPDNIMTPSEWQARVLS